MSAPRPTPALSSARQRCDRPFAKHPCPPGWQLVFSQINPHPPKSLPSSTPAKTDAHHVYVVCISDYEKLRGPRINQTGCRRKHSLFCAVRIFQQWLIFGMCLIWVCRAYSLSWEFIVLFLASLNESWNRVFLYITSRVTLCNPYLNTCNST